MYLYRKSLKEMAAALLIYALLIFEQAIAEISDNLKKSIDNKLYTCGVFLDFAKAFDTANHSILLKNYGIRGTPLDWFTSLL